MCYVAGSRARAQTPEPTKNGLARQLLSSLLFKWKRHNSRQTYFKRKFTGVSYLLLNFFLHLTYVYSPNSVPVLMGSIVELFHFGPAPAPASHDCGSGSSSSSSSSPQFVAEKKVLKIFTSQFTRLVSFTEMYNCFALLFQYYFT